MENGLKLCDHFQWKQILDQNINGSVNLYTCDRSKEILPISMEIDLFLEHQAPQLLDDYAKWLENQYCHQTSSWSQKKKNSRIASLIRRYHIEYKHALGCEKLTPEECAERFDTIDDFFTRELNPQFLLSMRNEYLWLRDDSHMLNEKDIMTDIENKIMVSPAECYFIGFPTVHRATEMYIKGNHYTTTKLLGIDHGQLYHNAMTLIFRLTMKHYHRFHHPISGEIIAISHLGSHHLSTQRQLITSQTNVYIDNVRFILYIKTLYFGVIAIVIIGATCASSVSFENPSLQSLFTHFGRHRRVQSKGALRSKDDRSNHFLVLSTPISITKHDLFGRFHYGGSTIVILVPHDAPVPPHASTNHLLTRLSEASKRDIETEIAVGQPVLFYNKKTDSPFG
jgi:phosphatidylserine decarboxylase precursor